MCHSGVFWGPALICSSRAPLNGPGDRYRAPSLLALPSNQRGHDLCARLGYMYGGPYRNTPDGPEFDLLLLHVKDDG